MLHDFAFSQINICYVIPKWLKQNIYCVEISLPFRVLKRKLFCHIILCVVFIFVKDYAVIKDISLNCNLYLKRMIGFVITKNYTLEYNGKE